MRPSDAGRTKAKGSCLLIRHAAPAIEPARPAAAWPLCDEGRAAARALGASLSLDAVVSSPEPKALQTAAALGAPVAVDGRLREHDRPNVGWREDFAAAVEAGFARPDEVVFGVESYAAALARFAAAVDAAVADHPGERLAIVSHGTVMALYVARVTGGDPVALWRSFGLPHVVEL